MYMYFRKNFPNFVSKIELGKGIPSVSYNLRHGDNVLIERKDPRQAINTLMKFGEKIEEKILSLLFSQKEPEVKQPFQNLSAKAA